MFKSKTIHKFALGVEYDGTHYCGWQRQNKVCSVQEKLEFAISKIANHNVDVICAGRTDAGVHGIGQVVHFETFTLRSNIAWTEGVNANLPDNISVKWAKEVPLEFHARFSATARRYRYLICNQKLRPGIFSHGMMHYHRPLNTEKMHHAAQCLVGENNFTSFRAINCQSSSPWRTIIYLNVIRIRQYVVIDIKANSFIYHMVRNIVGSLIEIGCGKQSENWIKNLLLAKNRILAGSTVKASGLYLVSVDYPAFLNFPKPPLGSLFL